MDPRKSFLHFLPTQNIEGALSAHIRGDVRPATARKLRPEEGPAIVPIMEEQYDLAVETVAKAKAARKGKGGRPPKVGLAILGSGPPRYRTSEQWQIEKELEWARAFVAFISVVLGPKSIIIAARLHRDESAPHCHIYAVPRDSNGVIGWSRRQKEALRELGLSVERGAEYGGAYEQLQDACWEATGKPFGLARGEPASQTNRRRQAPDPKIAMEIREENAKANLEAVTERIAEATELVAAETARVYEESARADAEAARAEEQSRRAEEEAARVVEAKAAVETARREEHRIRVGTRGVLSGKRSEEGQRILDEAEQARTDAEQARAQAERYRHEAGAAKSKMVSATLAMKNAEHNAEQLRERFQTEVEQEKERIRLQNEEERKAERSRYEDRYYVAVRETFGEREDQLAKEQAELEEAKRMVQEMQQRWDADRREYESEGGVEKILARIEEARKQNEALRVELEVAKKEAYKSGRSDGRRREVRAIADERVRLRQKSDATAGRPKWSLPRLEREVRTEFKKVVAESQDRRLFLQGWGSIDDELREFLAQASQQKSKRSEGAER